MTQSLFSWGLSRVLLNMHGVEAFYSRTVISVEFKCFILVMIHPIL